MGKKKKKSSKKPKEVPPFDPRSMERMMADIHKFLKGKEFKSEEELSRFSREVVSSGGRPPVRELTPLERAQDLVYDAWETFGDERVELAYKALEISKDCADAYIILAEEVARNLKEALKFYQQAVEAGKRALGPKVFKESVGHFWGILETRPYMRALAGLADCLWALGKRKEAIEHFLELLRLNPNDNQGIRYILVNCLLEEKRDDEAERLLNQYPDDPTACWQYSRALLKYRREGESGKANTFLKEAFDRNPYVPAYLLKKKKLPHTLPQYVGFGDESEAVDYAIDAANVWDETPGALRWLSDNLGKRSVKK